eukprot:5550522-Prymnesium_polylepis.1
MPEGGAQAAMQSDTAAPAPREPLAVELRAAPRPVHQDPADADDRKCAGRRSGDARLSPARRLRARTQDDQNDYHPLLYCPFPAGRAHRVHSKRPGECARDAGCRCVRADCG